MTVEKTKGNLETMLEKMVLPPQLRIMFFNSLLLQMQDQQLTADKTLGSEKWGEPVSVTFDFQEKQNTQWYNFEHFKSSSPFSDEQRNGLLSPLGFTKENMFLENEKIFCKLQFSTNEIYIQFMKRDGTNSLLTI